jgi:MoaA/NifB/PqqE/SkfB family radical SAM enzyme
MRSKNVLLDKYDSMITSNQKKYGNFIAFSITNSCPLNCDHCITNANSNDMEFTSAINYLQCLSQLININPQIEQIIITGGEPFYKPEKLKIFSNFCSANKLDLAVMTSGYWAFNYDNALEIINEYSGIKNYCISTDKYHIKYVPIDYIKNAYLAAKSLDKKVSIKITGETNNSLKKKTYLNGIFQFIEDEKDLIFQNLMPIGRAKENCKNEFTYKNEPPHIACTSSIIFIKEDGEVEPCCGPLPLLKTKHHMEFGSILRDDIPTIFRNIKTNWLFNFIRLWGFRDLIGYLRNSDLADRLPNSYVELPNNDFENETCIICGTLFADEKISDYLYTISKSLDFRLKVALGMRYYFDDCEPLNHLIGNYNPKFIVDEQLR